MERVQGVFRDALQKVQVVTVGHRELDGRFPTRGFLSIARWFIGQQFVLSVLSMLVTFFPFAFGHASLLRKKL